jgi:hypothetical protein
VQWINGFPFLFYKKKAATARQGSPYLAVDDMMRQSAAAAGYGSFQSIKINK